MAEKCSFDESLDEMLRDKIVRGISDERILQQLLAESTLTYSKAVEMALGMEAAAKNSQMLLGHRAVEEVNRVHQTSEVHQGHRTRCTHCGKTNHNANRCYFKRAKCHYYEKQGHIAKICRAAPKGRLMDLPQGRSSIKTVQQEEVRDEPLDTENEYLLFKFEDKKKPYTTIVNIDGKSVSMEIDTGASISITSQESYKELWPDRDLKESKAKLRTYSGEYLKVLGESYKNCL